MTAIAAHDNSVSGNSAPLWPRYAEVILCVGLWMVLGKLLRLDANQFLLLGVPLTVLFQWLVRRQPLRGLWVREAPTIALGWQGTAIAIFLGLVALTNLIVAAAGLDWVGIVFSCCALVGAFGAGYAARHFSRSSVAPLLGCLAVGLALDAVLWAIMLGNGFVAIRPVEGGWAVRTLIGVFSYWQYVAVCMVMEEVAFRMLDGHLHRPGDRYGILSAVFISAVWGLWHLPVLEEKIDWSVIGVLLLVHVPFGISLSLFWRRSGNLLIPAIGHALADGIRNAIIYTD